MKTYRCYRCSNQSDARKQDAMTPEEAALEFISRTDDGDEADGATYTIAVVDPDDGRTCFIQVDLVVERNWFAMPVDAPEDDEEGEE